MNFHLPDLNLPKRGARPYLSKPVIILFISIVIIVYVGFNIWFFYYKSNTVKIPPPSPTKNLYKSNQPSSSSQVRFTHLTSTPTPKPLGSHGKTTFTVGDSNTKEPQIGGGYLDPYDPQPDGKQMVSITVSYTQPVTSVQAILKTDHKTSNFPLTLVSGTPTNGRWEGSWTVSDTYLYTYNLVLQAESGSINSTTELTLR